MTSSLLFSIGWIFSDMTKGPSQIALTVALGIIIVLYFTMSSRDSASSTVDCTFEYLAMMAIAGLEIFSSVTRKGDPTWILSSFGNFFFGLCVLFVAFLMLVFQYTYLRGLLSNMAYAGDFADNFDSGFKVVIVAVIAAIIASFFGETYVYIVLGLFLAYQLFVVGSALWSSISNRGNIVYAIFACLLYLVSYVALLCMVGHFILPAIFALILYAISQGGGRSCYNCRSYSGGYCSYRRKYVNNEENGCGAFRS